MSRPLYGTCVAVPSGRVSHICSRCSRGRAHDKAADLLCRHRCARAGGGAAGRDGRAAVAARVGRAGSGLLPQNEPDNAAFARKLLVPAPQGRLPRTTTCSGSASSHSTYLQRWSCCQALHPSSAMGNTAGAKLFQSAEASDETSVDRWGAKHASPS